MAFKTLERKEAQTLTMGKEGLMTVEGILVAARTGIGRNASALYTLRCKDGVTRKIWGNVSIDQALLDDTGKRLVPDVANRLIRIEVLEMVPVGDNGAERAECEVSVDTSIRQFETTKPAAGKGKK